MRRLAVIALAGLAALAAGCSDDDGGGEPSPSPGTRAELVRAARTTEATRTARFEVRLSGPGLDASARGVADFVSERERGPVLLRQRASPGARIETVRADAVTQDSRDYFRTEPGGLYVEVLDDAGTPQGISSVVESLQYLRSVERVAEEASELVDGVPTTRYRFAIDRGELRQRVPAAERDMFDRRIRVIEEYTGQVWIDGQDRVRRVRQLISLSTGGQLTALSRLSAFGEPGPVARLRADQISEEVVE